MIGTIVKWTLKIAFWLTLGIIYWWVVVNIWDEIEYELNGWE